MLNWRSTRSGATRPGSNPLASAAAKRPGRLWHYAPLLLLTAVSILFNGYHYATDDGGIYLPAMIQRLQPSLYPFNVQFIHAHSSLSVYAVIGSALAHVLGGSVPWTALLLHCLGVFLLLAASWRLARHLFSSTRAAWGAVCVLACATSFYVAGTSIPIMDPYFTARTLSTPLTVAATACAVERRWRRACFVLLLAVAIHPLMALFAAVLIAGYATAGAVRMPAKMPLVATSILPFGLALGSLDGTARETMGMTGRTFFFASRWDVFDWAGVIVPLAILFFTWRTPLRASTPILRRLCASALICGGVTTLFFLLISFAHPLEALTRLQPMRIFQLVYVLMFLIVGGLLGEYALREPPWRWALLLLMLGAVDVSIDHAAYPASAHIELPGVQSYNAWVQAFTWVSKNTPEQALFALPPDYIQLPGEDRHGFRSMAQRSSLADEFKDSGLVAVFPDLGAAWKNQMRAQANWNNFTAGDFHALAKQYPVSWVVVQLPQARGLDCPYRNAVVAVCRIA